MNNILLDKVIASNKKFLGKVNSSKKNSKILLYECFYGGLPLLYGINKVALTIANIKGLKPVGIKPLRGSNESNRFIKSMNSNLVGSKWELFFSLIKNSFFILKDFLMIRNKDELLNLKIGKCKVGEYLYDQILTQNRIPTLNKLTFKIKLRIALELNYFYFFKTLINKNKVEMIVIGDNVYRYGLLFELAKFYKIECITPINLNGFSMRKYLPSDDFNVHCRRPSENSLINLDYEKVSKHMVSYFSKRFTAQMEQHDVLKAFAGSKKKLSKDDLIDEYGLKRGLPTVAVMAHIFCDAPHAYPDALYGDYKEWLVKTVESLKKNKRINFLVKEHPSSDLYNEKGIINLILKELGCEHFLLRNDVHTSTVLDEFDIVITCGGTIGQEFAYKGKPVVLGAKPPYSGFGFTIEPSTKRDYENLLSNGIENLLPLNNKQKAMVNKVIYYDFILLNNYSDDLEIGGQRFYMGREFDYEEFFEAILDYNKIELVDQIIFKKLKNFVNSRNRHLLKEGSKQLDK